jgi:MOSC domain-containing protein YiiM
MELISVNIGSKRTQPKGDEIETTGIYKLPTREPVQIKSLGIAEDFICDQKNHGGPDQAIYVYGAADYSWWSKELGREIEAGTFGENLTVSELESAQVNIGDRLHVGSVILEVTAPRIPCSTLAARMKDPQFVKHYRRAERPGLYCRVIQEGMVKVGDQVSIEKPADKSLSIGQAFRDYYEKLDADSIRRYLNLPIAVRWRIDLEEDLAKLNPEK